MLVAGDDDRNMKVWNVSDWSLLRALGNSDFVFGVAFSPDDQTLAVAGGYSGNWIRLWRTSDWQQTAILGYGQAQNNAVAHSPDGQFKAGALPAIYRCPAITTATAGPIWLSGARAKAPGTSFGVRPERG